MEKIKNKHTLRIIFSSAALITFVLYSLCDILMVNEYASYNTYGWRLKVLNYLFLIVPYVALFVFSVTEQKLKHINQRTYVVGLFAIYLIQAIVMIFCNGASDFSIFCCGVIGRFSSTVIGIMIIRAIMLFLIPVAHKLLLKIYSLGIIGFLCLTLISNFSSEYLMMRFGTKGIIAIIIDILFHVALYFFGELLNKNNESEFWQCFLGVLKYPIFGDSLQDDDFEDEYEYENECRVNEAFPKTNYVIEYKSLFIDALNKGDETFLKTNEVLRGLACERVFGEDNHIYSSDDIVSHLTIVAKKIEDLNLKKPGLISDNFAKLINTLIAKKDEESFKMDVIAVAKLLFEDNTSSWTSATNKFFDHSLKLSDDEHK